MAGPSLTLLWITPIALCSVVPYPPLLPSSSFHDDSPVQRRDILPPYSNASSMPLYGPSRVPKHSDINQVVTNTGWFEAFAAALIDTNSKVITDHLLDCGDGTVNVTLFQGSQKPEKTFNVNKRGWGSVTSNNSVAWPGALFNGLKELSSSQNSSSSAIIDQAIIGVYANSTTTSCRVAASPAPNPYQMTTKLPIIALMRLNATDTSIAGRYLHVMAYNASSKTDGDYVSFDSASIPGAGSGVKNLALFQWDKDCLSLIMPLLSGN